MRDPLGGINSLWPLFGIANQMLAAIALCLAVTVILKMQLVPTGQSNVQSSTSKVGRPAFALIAFIPLAWLLLVTMTAGVQKIWSSNPKIGFLAQAKAIEGQIQGLQHVHTVALSDLLKTGIKNGQDSPEFKAAQAAVDETWAPIVRQRTLRFNNRLDAVVTLTFLLLVAAVFLISVREWLLLLARKKAADLRETPPTWLPDYMLAQAKPLSAMALLALAFALAKELSGEADLDRARHTHTCACAEKSDVKIYTEVTEARFKGVRRCC